MLPQLLETIEDDCAGGPEVDSQERLRVEE